MAWQHSSKFQQLQILPFAKCQQNGNYWNIFFVIIVNFRIKDKPIARACTLGSAYVGTVFAGKFCPYKQKTLNQKYLNIWMAILGNNILPK